MAVIDRIGVVIPADTQDPAADARRLESLGFAHAAMPSHSPAQTLLALGATRTLPLHTNHADLCTTLGVLPSNSLNRLKRLPDHQPLQLDLAASCPIHAVTRALEQTTLITVDLMGGPHAWLVHTLALDVLTENQPGVSTAMLQAEDLTIGQTFDLGEYTITEDDIISFAEKWDPLDIHIDPVPAAASPLGVLCASGVHTQAIMQRLSARALHRNLVVVAGRGMLGMRLWKPVTPGTTLRGTTEIIEVQFRPSGRAIVTVRSTLTTDGDRVLEQTGELLVQQRTT